MQFDVRWVRPSGLENGVYMLERQAVHASPQASVQFETARLGEYWVPQCPLLMETIDWSFVRSGDRVRVPVFAYRTVRAMSSLWGLGIQCGMIAAASLAVKTGQMPTAAVLILGSECPDLGAQGLNNFQCYAGIALQIN